MTRTRVNMTIRPAELAVFDQLARDAGLSRGQLVESWVKEHLGQLRRRARLEEIAAESSRALAGHARTMYADSQTWEWEAREAPEEETE